MRCAPNSPGTDEERAATELLAALDRTSGTPPENPRKAGTTGEYKPDAGQHYFALIVPNSGTDLNAIKTSISTFNRDYYPATPVQITNTFLDPEHQVVLLSFFESKQQAMEYFSLFSSASPVLTGINDQGYPAFPITTENYSQLFRSKDVEGYTSFFTENYVDGQ